MYAFGDNQFGQLGLDFSVTYQRTASEVTLLTRVGKVVSVATGRGFTLAVLASGAIYSFGFGQHGQLGHGECENSNRPKRIQSLGSYHIVSVAAGDRHSLAIDNEGACWSWGCNDRGQLYLCHILFFFNIVVLDYLLLHLHQHLFLSLRI